MEDNGGVNAPTYNSIIQIKEEFYEELEKVLLKIAKHREIIFMRDLNARTGRKNDAKIGNDGENVCNEN